MNIENAVVFVTGCAASSSRSGAGSAPVVATTCSTTAWSGAVFAYGDGAHFGSAAG